MPVHSQRHRQGLLDLQTEPPGRTLLCRAKPRHLCVKALLPAVHPGTQLPARQAGGAAAFQQPSLLHHRRCKSSSAVLRPARAASPPGLPKARCVPGCTPRRGRSSGDLRCKTDGGRLHSPASGQCWRSVVRGQQHLIRDTDRDGLSPSLHNVFKLFQYSYEKAENLKQRGSF